MKTCQIGLRWSSKVSGGAERIFSELAAGLPTVGIEFLGAVAGTAALSAETHGLIHAFAPEESGTLTRLRGSRRLLNALLSEERPDILASHFALYTLPVLNRLRAQPFVMHFHGPWAMESGVEGGSAPAVFAKQQIERAVYTRADTAITLSKAFATLLHQQYGVAEDRIRIIPGAVDLDRFTMSPSRAEARDRLGWPKDRPILLTVRRLVQRMGLQSLLEALPAIREMVPDVLLLLAGTGPIRPELERFVKDQSLEGSVRFLGFLPEELLANGIPCGPIYSIDQVFADPQVKHLGMATKMHSPHVGEKEVVASAINISGFSKAIRVHTPDAGEHGDEILKSVGYTDAELDNMRRKGII